MDQQEIIMSYSRRLLICFTFAWFGLAGGGFSTAALAQDDFSKILVAKPELKDALYGSTILIARDMPDGSTMGFILNKPTRLTLGERSNRPNAANRAEETRCTWMWQGGMRRC